MKELTRSDIHKLLQNKIIKSIGFGQKRNNPQNEILTIITTDEEKYCFEAIANCCGEGTFRIYKKEDK